jgi:exodeoxyribonuclease V gamma subunit
MDALVDRLLEQFDANPIGPLDARAILVPNGAMKQWLLLEIAKKRGIAMGLKVVTLAEGILQKNSPLEMLCHIYDELREAQDPDLLGYLDGKKGRLLNLAAELASLFGVYGQFGEELFDPKKEAINWQHAILQKLFVKGPWRMPVQILPELKPASICLFGIDDLPPLFWDFFFRAPSLSIYLFSPCIDFWEDLCSERERRSLNRYWKKRKAKEESRVELDRYLREGPPMLANWGKLGRETLKIFDRFDLQMEEVYPEIKPDSLLKRVQNDLLHFEKSEKGVGDDSVRIFMTGSSRLREVECLREEILRLNVPYCEISVMAPDIEPYVPLIEFVFGDVPYRISGFDIGSQSSFRQGLARLVDLGRWDGEKILALFETPAFYRKRGWDEAKLELFRNWITEYVKWGIDGKHQREVLCETLGEKSYDVKGSWEEGLDRLLDGFVYLRPLQVNADHFEEFLEAISALKAIVLTGERTLAAWGECLGAMAAEFLQADADDEADMAAQNSFQQFLFDLKASRMEEKVFPFAVVQKLLLRPCSGQIHASHLHAVRFAPLEEGALLPAKAVFLIGMDEEHFPRMKIPSSFDLLKNQTPEKADRDRYLFLQALFSAEEYLRISYGHLSADEGKPIGPSLLVQELMDALGLVGTVYRAGALSGPKKGNGLWPSESSLALPVGEVTLAIADLRLLARHPWKFFLQKVHGIYLNEPIEESFALLKGQLMRALLAGEEIEEKLPHGSLGKALQIEIDEEVAEWKGQLAEWQVEPFTLIFRDTCAEKQWEGADCVVPPLEVMLDGGLKVRLVGEIKQATERGLLCANGDKVDGLLKVWPEALVTALALGAPQVCMLRSGKMKEIGDPLKELKAFIEYYFRNLSAPSPLLPDWADSLLRKGSSDLEAPSKDPVAEWVLARAEIPTVDHWSPYLNQTFGSLAALYPTRGKKHENV